MNYSDKPNREAARRPVPDMHRILCAKITELLAQGAHAQEG